MVINNWNIASYSNRTPYDPYSIRLRIKVHLLGAELEDIDGKLSIGSASVPALERTQTIRNNNPTDGTIAA